MTSGVQWPLQKGTEALRPFFTQILSVGLILEMVRRLYTEVVTEPGSESRVVMR